MKGRTFSGLSCPICRKGRLVRRYGPVKVLRDDGSTGWIPPMPHDHCPHCGEDLYDDATIHSHTSRRRMKKAS
mgnify:CR=1 FL=1